MPGILRKYQKRKRKKKGRGFVLGEDKRNHGGMHWDEREGGKV